MSFNKSELLAFLDKCRTGQILQIEFQGFTSYALYVSNTEARLKFRRDTKSEDWDIPIDEDLTRVAIISPLVLVDAANAHKRALEKLKRSLAET